MKAKIIPLILVLAFMILIWAAGPVVAVEQIEGGYGYGYSE